MLRLTRAGILRTVVVPAVPAAGGAPAVIVALHVTITAEMVMAPAGLGGAMARAMQTLTSTGSGPTRWCAAFSAPRSTAAAAAGRGRPAGSPADHRVFR
jgi:hypothetical protein